MIHSFAPIVNAATKIIILGTIPSIISLEKQEYYGNKQNQFWRILYAVLGVSPVATVFEERVQFLKQNTIGLWDVLKNCERKGSLDVHIKNQVVNDFESFFKAYPSIDTIIFNGKKSEAYFLKKFGALDGMTYFVMPSTSPANTMLFEKKLEIWSGFLK